MKTIDDDAVHALLKRADASLHSFGGEHESDVLEELAEVVKTLLAERAASRNLDEETHIFTCVDSTTYTTWAEQRGKTFEEALQHVRDNPRASVASEVVEVVVRRRTKLRYTVEIKTAEDRKPPRDQC